MLMASALGERQKTGRVEASIYTCVIGGVWKQFLLFIHLFFFLKFISLKKN